jgi:hypothetical protein
MSSEKKFAITRRQLFRLGAAAGAAALVQEGIDNKESGIETKHGIFYPMYEGHYGLTSHEFPSYLDYLFREANALNKSIFHTSIEDIWWLLDQESQDYVSKNKVPIVLGDPSLGLGILTTAEFILKPALAYGLFRLSERVEQGVEGPMTDRKKFMLDSIRNAAKFFGATGLIGCLPGISVGLRMTRANVGALTRVIERGNGLLSHYSPENVTVFFRNLVIAERLFFLAEQFHSTTQQKARIAFQVGGGHAGIEDFLRVGPEVVRHLLLSYPQEWLDYVVKCNDDISTFCSVRLITCGQNPDSSVYLDSDTRMIDTNLMVDLEKKLNIT